ncbi:hypothetical protein PFISCL1PPCAC_21023, partial [Pristionchus fissidentatus]
ASESPMTKQPDFVIPLTVHGGNVWTQKLSPSVEHNGTKWRLRAEWVEYSDFPDEGLLVQLECLSHSELTNDWNVEAECILPSQNSGKIARKQLKAVFGPGVNIVDFGHLISYTDFQHLYVTQSRVTFEARIYINRSGEVDEVVAQRDFSAPLEDVAHVVLRIGEKRLHVAKDVLAVHSPVFRAMLYGDFKDKNQAEIEIKEVVYEEFVDLLCQIYPNRPEITEKNFENILKLADRYEVESATSEVIRFLRRSKYENTKLLMLADKYRLEAIKDRCISAFRSTAEITALKTKIEYGDLSDATKLALFERMMEMG